MIAMHHPVLFLICKDVLLLLSVVTGCMALNQAPFYVKFIGEDNEVAFSKENVSFGHAVNLCVKICKDNWWCSALRKCADSDLSFRCHVTCRLQKFNVNFPKPEGEKCHLQEVSILFLLLELNARTQCTLTMYADILNFVSNLLKTLFHIWYFQGPYIRCLSVVFYTMFLRLIMVCNIHLFYISHKMHISERETL
jgi:hypothetical protein